MIDSHLPLGEAFSLLITNSILSAPVYDAAEHKYLGFLDVRDLVAFSVFAAKENSNIQSLNDIVAHGTKLHSKTQDTITVSCKSPFFLLLLPSLCPPLSFFCIMTMMLLSKKKKRRRKKKNNSLE